MRKVLLAVWLRLVWNPITALWKDHQMGRMLQWAVFSALLYALVFFGVWPLIIQAALTKGANVNAGAFLGYWVDRSLFSSFDLRFDADPNSISDVARAARVGARGVICGCCILGLSLGTSA